MWEITMDQNRLNFDIQRENQRHAEWAADFGLKNQQFDLEKLKLKLEYEKTSGLGFVNEPISDEERKNVPLHVESNYQSQIAERDGLAKQITIEYYKRLNPRTTGETNIAYNDRLNRLIEQKAGEEDLQSHYNRIASQEASNKGSVNPIDKDILKQYENAVRLTNFQKDEIEATKAEAREIAKRQGLTVPTDEEIKGSTSGLTVRVGEFRDKRDVNLSPQDLMDFISLHPEAMNKFGPVYLDFPGKEQRGKKEEAKLRLQQKYGKDFDQIHYSLFQPNMFGQFTKIHPEIGKMIGNLNSSEYKKLKEIEADLYIKNGTIQQPKSFAILAGKEKETDVQAKISNVIEVYKNLKPEEIRKALGENKNAARITAYPQQDGTSKYVLQITGVDGKEGAPLEIDAEKFEYIMGTPPPTSMQKPMVISMLDRHGTTNMSKTTNPETAFFKPDDFVNFNDPNYILKGDLVNVTGNSDKVYLYLYLYDKGGNYIRTITYPDPKDEGSRLTKYNNDRSYNISLQYAPIGITSEVIKQLTKSK